MTTSAGPDGRRHRVVLRLLDHQVVGPEGQLLGNVDDLLLQIHTDRWVVTDLLVGPAALGRRLPGRLGTWTTAIWRRLQTEPTAGPARVPVSEVTDIGSAIKVSDAAAAGLTASFGFETWLRTYVVSRIPGAKGGGDHRGAFRAPVTTRPDPAPPTASVGELVQARVLDEDGAQLGTLNELIVVEPPGAKDRLLITHVQYGRHKAGSELGYDEDSGQGPLLVGAVVRWWQRDSRVAPVTDVIEVDLDGSSIILGAPQEHVHPHRLDLSQGV